MNELTIRQLETLESYLLEQEEELPRWFRNLRARYKAITDEALTSYWCYVTSIIGRTTK